MKKGVRWLVGRAKEPPFSLQKPSRGIEAARIRGVEAVAEVGSGIQFGCHLPKLVTCHFSVEAGEVVDDDKGLPCSSLADPDLQ